MTSIDGYVVDQYGTVTGFRQETVTHDFSSIAGSADFKKVEDRTFGMTPDPDFNYHEHLESIVETYGTGTGTIQRTTRYGIVLAYHVPLDKYYIAAKWELPEDGRWTVRFMNPWDEDEALIEVRPWLDGPDLGIDVVAGPQDFFETLYDKVRDDDPDVLAACIKTAKPVEYPSQISLDLVSMESVGGVRLGARYRTSSAGADRDRGIDLYSSLPDGLLGTRHLPEETPIRLDLRDGSGEHFSMTSTYQPPGVLGRSSITYAIVDGRGTAKGWSRVHDELTGVTEITERKVTFSYNPVTHTSTILAEHPLRTVTLEDNRGLVLERRQVLVQGGTTTTVSTETMTYDADGKLTDQAQNDRTVFTRGATTTSASGGVTYKTHTETDETGVVRTIKERDDGLPVEETKAEFTAAGGYPAQPSIKTTHAYTKSGNTLVDTATLLSGTDTVGITTAVRTTDATGRTISATDAGGRTTTTAYNEAARTTTETLPGTLVRTTTTYRDGRVKTIKTTSGGTVIDQEYHVYTVNDGSYMGAPEPAGSLHGLPHGSITETVYLNDDGTGGVRSLRWRKTTTNTFGWVMREEQPGPGRDGAGNAVNIVKIHTYSPAGDLLRTQTTGMADTLYANDLLGLSRVTAQDLNGNGVIDAGEAVETVTTSYVAFVGGWAEQTLMNQTVPAGSGPLVQATAVRRKLGTGPEELTETDYNDGRTVRTATVIDRTGKKVTRTTTTKTPTQSGSSTVQVAVNGLLMSATLPGVNAANAVIYSHDKYGRTNGMTDPRSGASSWTLNDEGKTLTSTDASNVTTTFDYYAASTPQAGSLKSVTVGTGAGAPQTFYLFDPVARVSYQWGTATTPVKYVYDAYGQMTEMHTYPNKADFASGPEPPVVAFASAGRKTTWNYDPASGALLSKVYGADTLGTEYGYYPSGLLASRQWVRTSTAAAGQRVKTTYTYQTNGSGRLAGITYNDGNDGTTGVSYTGYSPEGYVTGMTDAAGTHVMSAGMSPLGEYSDAITGGLLGGVQVSRGTDQSGASVPPPSRLVARMNNTQLTATDTFLGTSWGRIESVRPGTLAYNAMTYRHLFSYGYRASSGQLELVTSVDLQNQYAYANGTQSRGTGYRSLKRAWAYNSNTARPTSLRWYKEETRTGAASTLTTAVGWNYPEYDELGRKKRVDAYEAQTQGLPGWSYEYDKAGEVTRAKRFNILTNGTDSAIASQRRDYDYDGVGNRDTASQGTGAALRTVSYHANEHNQYANDGSTPAVLHPRYVEITGQAAIGAVVQVKVNGEIGIPISGSNTDGWGTGEPGSYRREVPVAGTDAQWLDVEISASVGGGTPVVKRGWMYAPPLNETQVHDEDGNLKEDARWTYEWGAENQLRAQEEKALTYYTGPGAASPPVRKRLEFAHDARHRRIQKVVKSFSSTSQTFVTTLSDTRFVYDQWNLIAELDALNGMRAIRTYTWGPDLSGTLQGAGGVGGLLAVTHQGTSYHVCSDANGNVTALYATSGTQAGKVVARYDYDPFGNRITDTGPGVEICPFAFSTKYRDEETGDYDYINRVYDAPNGRWRSKDRIGERGGLNLYGMCHNDTVNHADYLGWKDFLDPWSNKQQNTGQQFVDIERLIAVLKDLTSVKGKKDGKKCFDVEINRNAATNRDFLVASRSCDISFYIAHGSNPRNPSDPKDRTMHPDGTDNTGINQSDLNQHASANGKGQPQCFGCSNKPYPDREKTPSNTVMRALTEAIKALKTQQCCPKVRKVCLTVGLDDSGELARNGGGSPEIPPELIPATPLSNR
ncbi:MAG: hypothetical protein K1X78_01070 [Verrucomicrobiaceae bacterium]|nr:hypothetical protein [Verrucomicrobiaceae bacterium]